MFTRRTGNPTPLSRMDQSKEMCYLLRISPITQRPVGLHFFHIQVWGSNKVCFIHSPLFTPSLLFDCAQPRHPSAVSGSSLLCRRPQKTKKEAGSRNPVLTSGTTCFLRPAPTNYTTTILTIDMHACFFLLIENMKKKRDC